MKIHALGAAGLAVLLAGCASNPPAPTPTELMAGVKRVAFVQHGTVPLRQVVRGVDGKTFWAGASGVQFVPGSSAPADARMAGQANVITAVAGLVAQQSIQQDPEQYARTLRGVIGGRPVTREMADAVFPALATHWGTSFQPGNIAELPADAALVTPTGVYAGPPVDADLVVAYSVDEMMVIEKFGAGSLFKAMATLGLGDREVVPSLQGSLTAFKRDEKGELRQVWKLPCPQQGTGFFGNPVDVRWSELVANPSAGAPLLDHAVPVAIDNCKKAISAKAG